MRMNHFVSISLTTLAITIGFTQSTATQTPAPQQREPDFAQQMARQADTDKTRGFTEYSRHYLATDGQRYCSDTHQLGAYVEGYHDAIDAALGCRGSEMISELYVPREQLADFLQSGRARTGSGGGIERIGGLIVLVDRDLGLQRRGCQGQYECGEAQGSMAHRRFSLNWK